MNNGRSLIRVRMKRFVGRLPRHCRSTAIDDGLSRVDISTVYSDEVC
jgi:hypothetical protein